MLHSRFVCLPVTSSQLSTLPLSTRGVTSARRGLGAQVVRAVTTQETGARAQARNKSPVSNSTMKLYDYPLAFNPAKARLIFAEKGTPHTTEFVNLFTGPSLSPYYLRINPSGSVPTLVDGSKVITESRELIDYVDNRDGQPLGGDIVDRKFVKDWLKQVDAFDGNLFIAAQGPKAAMAALAPLNEHRKRYAEAKMKQNPDMAEVYRKKLEAMAETEQEPKNPAAVAKNRQQLVELLDLAEERLATRTHLAGDAYSAADVIFTPVLYRIGQVGRNDEFLKPHPRVAQYWESLKSRPSFKTVFGPQQNPLYAGSLVVPALAWATLCRVLNWY